MRYLNLVKRLFPNNRLPQVVELTRLIGYNKNKLDTHHSNNLDKAVEPQKTNVFKPHTISNKQNQIRRIKKPHHPNFTHSLFLSLFQPSQQHSVITYY